MGIGPTPPSSGLPLGAQERALRATALDPFAVLPATESGSAPRMRTGATDATTSQPAVPPRVRPTTDPSTRAAAATGPAPAAPTPTHARPSSAAQAAPASPQRPADASDAPDTFTATRTAAETAAGIEPLPAPLRFAADAARASLTAGRPEKALTLLEGAWPETPSAELHALKAEGLLELGRDTESLDAASRGVLRSPLAAAPRWVAAQAAVRLDAPAHAAAFLGPLLSLAEARVLRTPASADPAPPAAAADPELIEADVVDEAALRALVPKRAAAGLAELAERVLVQADLARAAEREAPRAGARRSAYDQRRMASLAAAEAALPAAERRAIADGDGVQRVRAWVAARNGQSPVEVGLRSAMPEWREAELADAGVLTADPVEVHVWGDGEAPAPAASGRSGAPVRDVRGLGVQLDVVVDDGYAVHDDVADAPDGPDSAPTADSAVLRRAPFSSSPAAVPPSGVEVGAPRGLLPAPSGVVTATPDAVNATPSARFATAGEVMATSGVVIATTTAEIGTRSDVITTQGAAIATPPPQLPASAASMGDLAGPVPVADPAAPSVVQIPLPGVAATPDGGVQHAGLPSATPNDGVQSPASAGGAPMSSADAAPAASADGAQTSSAGGSASALASGLPETASEVALVAERAPLTLNEPAAGTAASPPAEAAETELPSVAAEGTAASAPAPLSPRDLPMPADPALLVAWLGVDAEVMRLGPSAAGLSVPAAGILGEMAPRPRAPRPALPVTWRGAVRLTLVGAALVCLAVDRQVSAGLLAGLAVWWWWRDGRRAVQLEAGKAATAER